MLVLTRKSGEKIRIGKDIIISVVENSIGQVKIGITAPKQITVFREEIYNEIQQENKASLVSNSFSNQLLKRLKGKFED